MTRQNRRTTAKGEPFYFFQASGSDYEIGLRKGQEMAADIPWMWEYFRPNMETWVGKSDDAHCRGYDWLHRNLDAAAPWMVEQMSGMADGSGVTVEQIHYGFLWTTSGAFCSSLAVSDSNAGPLLGQNLDIGDDDNYSIRAH